MRPRPATFELTLPDGRRVRCWRRDAAAIRRDVRTTGSVMLVGGSTDGVYEHVPWGSDEARALAPISRRV